ncbi:hypothetical protein Val02_75510 [Virgisporangium aliadipatigenens]|uniref:DUF998 domain-containing protein n=1 Tax=Virgisporangium aliadipatigenens TaxID=741659 RepID=A0A8J4DTW3_9ACTN|nr:hypothetical protein Val02_75510 [Virgisporangium aliadipatigenens]
MIAAFVSGVVLVGVADALNPQWNWVEEMASHFVNGTAGWLIPTALVLFGAASATVTAVVLGSPGRSATGVWLMAGWSLGLLVAAVFPADPPGQWDRPPSTAGLVHGIAGMLAFVLLPSAAVLVTRRVRVRSRALVLAAAASVVATALYLVTWVDVLDGPTLTFGGFEKVTGLTERLLLWADLIWLSTVCVVLRRPAGRM